MESAFRVDLRGVVDILSHHLYSSPRVYVRELLQNSVDAITARQRDDAGAPAAIAITTGPRTLTITDTGVGLTEAQVHELLATIGRSSKRDDLGYARHEFLGQFGIGLLSAFLVADGIAVTTRSVTGAPAVLWSARSDGTYSVTPAQRAEPGTTVTLTARPGADPWFDPRTVADLARSFGSMLPFPVTVDGVPVTGRLPWADDGRTAGGRRADLVGYAQDVLGFTPFDVIELSVPAAGLTGVAYVLPFAANPGKQAPHRVYLKRMLLAENARGLLPDWSFFVQCVVDSSELRPTASREGLYEDDQLDATRDALGAQLSGWLAGLARTNPDRLRRFLDIHHIGVKALALHDDEMLALVDRWWPMETNVGRMTLADFRANHGTMRYAATVEEFRQLSAVAAAQDVAVVNGGYTFDGELIERLARLDRPEGSDPVRVERMDPSALADRFAALDPAVELACRPFVLAAQATVDRLGCEVQLRSFEPVALPVLYLLDRSAAFQQELRATRERADDLWAGVLSAFDKPYEDRPQLVFNHRNPLVRRIVGMSDPELVELVVEALYGHALLLGQHPLRPADMSLLNTAFLGLVERALPEGSRGDR
ncbi:HSP90 family protein [Actinomycetes bacterium KLBMP 9759]